MNKNKHLTKEWKRKIGEANKIALKGRRLSLKTRERMSESKIGHKHSEKTKIKIGNSRKGIKHTNKAKKKISIARIGKKLSKKTKIKIGNAHRGMKRPKGTGKKISKALKGRKKPEGFGKKISKIQIGRTVSLEIKNLMSKIMKKSARRGKTHPFWKGGVTPINLKIRKCRETIIWKQSVLIRDDYTCQKCSKKENIELHPHHIKNFSDYPELRFAIDNGITFCKKCHNTFHKIYGYRNNTMEQVKNFIGGKYD